MKIGAFAKKFNINRETVRYYTDKLLLNPIKTRTHYDYSEDCVEDMRTILRLKEMGFTLKEIASYLSFFRNSTKNMLAMKEELFDFFDKKIADIDNKIEELKASRIELLNRLNEIKDRYKTEEGEEERIGFPIEFLSKLICPICGSPLTVENGEIFRNYIMSGQIICNCGYKAAIKDGIIVFDGVDYEDIIEEKLQYLNEDELMPPEYTSVMHASCNWIQEKLQKEALEGKIIFDPMTQGVIRSNQIIERLTEKGEDFYFIGMDIHYPQVQNFKKLLSMNKNRPKTIFLAGSYENAPIERGSCDYISCFFGLQTYSVYQNDFPIDNILEFLKQDGKWFETFCCVNDKRLISEKYRSIQNTIACDTIKDKMSDKLHVSFVNAGETDRKSELSIFFKDGAKVNFFSFVGEKR